MNSKRYGDLRDVAAHSDGDCHLCRRPIDLSLYGPTGFYGAETVTVDHLWPQSAGGSDDFDNLRIAHGTCNSSRGTRDVEEVRLDLSGTTRAPMSSGERRAWSMAGGCAAGLGAGYAFAKPAPDGSRQFNSEAALIFGLLATAWLRLAD